MNKKTVRIIEWLYDLAMENHFPVKMGRWNIHHVDQAMLLANQGWFKFRYDGKWYRITIEEIENGESEAD